MKNIIANFYGIRVNEKITTKDNRDYYFVFNNKLYCFSELTLLEVKRIIELYSKHILPSNFHNIIMNKNGGIFSLYKEKNYILMKVNCEGNLVSYIEILNYYNELLTNGMLFNNISINWHKLWRTKVDYLEYYIQKNESINSNLKCLCNYFIGMSEIAIALIEFVLSEYGIDFFYEEVTFCHERITKSYTLHDLYNPKNIILDHYSRDISEYLKSLIFSDDYKKNLKLIIEKVKFTNTGYILLLARTIFPTFFYDKLSDIDSDTFNNGELIKMYDYISRYEKLICILYFYLIKKIRLPHIEWLANLD